MTLAPNTPGAPLGSEPRSPAPPESVPGARLNVGCGRFPLAGWLNLDLQALPTVDRVVDVRQGLPFRDAAAIYAEHFLEHLTLGEALDFLRAAHGALAPDGRLRLSTPNLEWVWATHSPSAPDPADAQRRALVANRAFYGWEHRFLWTRPLLGAALAACGFGAVRFERYGESADPGFRGLEQHERYPDDDELPHVLIVECDRKEFAPERFDSFLRQAREHFLDHLRG